jgi:hypothetical protein
VGYVSAYPNEPHVGFVSKHFATDANKKHPEVMSIFVRTLSVGRGLHALFDGGIAGIC